jgi:beta-lactamase class D
MHQTILLLSLILTNKDNITNQVPSTQPVTSQIYAKPNWQERVDFEKYFQQAGVKGSFVIYNLKKNQYLAYNPKRVNTGFLPASTFKIFNSLVALETGVIKDENQVIKWDGVKREVAEWNQDQTMRSAIKYSAVWFYQELARRIGEKRMQYYMNLANYGNRNISGGIDKFWLEGELRITSKQQIDFLVKLYRNQLPFSRRSINIVKDILINEKTNNYVLRGKTGIVRGVTQQIGWYVSYIESKNNVNFFAINIDLVKSDDAKARIAITKRILKDMGLLNNPPAIKQS